MEEDNKQDRSSLPDLCCDAGTKEFPEISRKGTLCFFYTQQLICRAFERITAIDGIKFI